VSLYMVRGESSGLTCNAKKRLIFEVSYSTLRVILDVVVPAYIFHAVNVDQPYEIPWTVSRSAVCIVRRRFLGFGVRTLGPQK